MLHPTSLMIESLATQVEKPERAVYNLHVPPVNTALDKAPAVSHDFNSERRSWNQIDARGGFIG
jgi:hypothetical protein